MFEKSLKVVLVLQIILTGLAVSDVINPSNEEGQEVIENEQSNRDGDENLQLNEPDAENIQLNEPDPENIQLNEPDAENIQLNESDAENVQLIKPDSKNIELNNEDQHGKVQEVGKQDAQKSHNKGYRQNKKSSFKYAMDKKDEPGFDLTPEEMEKFKIWKDGVIPYYIDAVSFSDKVLRDTIRNYLQMVNSATSVNFVELPTPPTDDNERWVFFMNRRGLLGCADHTVKNFTSKGVQQVVLGYDCIATRGEIAEAVMSIVGVPAQHNAPDRDKYIKVNLENVVNDKTYLFEKLNDNEWLFHDLAYDFNSVTHYDIHKYSSNGHATIELKDKSEDLNPATAFSATDLTKIKMLYNFVTRSKKMQTPDCEKLFKISSKFRSDSSIDKRTKPRKKPNKYLGISSNDNTESLPMNEPIDENEDQMKNKIIPTDGNGDDKNDKITLSGKMKQRKLKKIKNYDMDHLLLDMSDYKSS